MVVNSFPMQDVRAMGLKFAGFEEPLLAASLLVNLITNSPAFWKVVLSPTGTCIEKVK